MGFRRRERTGLLNLRKTIVAPRFEDIESQYDRVNPGEGALWHT
jgi:hypothetical protein